MLIELLFDIAFFPINAIFESLITTGSTAIEFLSTITYVFNVLNSLSIFLPLVTIYTILSLTAMFYIIKASLHLIIWFFIKTRILG